ncbi:MAG: hypothetical protein IJQ67_04385, partial [Bacilli bacterium]|nr:hypothetical protein [Bacilli bacterium]
MTRNIKNLKKLNNDRYDYSSVSGELPLPDLVEVQRASYEEFRTKGLDDVFRESFPIPNYSDTLSLEYVSCRIGDEKHTPQYCKERGLTYCAPIYATLKIN